MKPTFNELHTRLDALLTSGHITHEERKAIAASLRFAEQEATQVSLMNADDMDALPTSDKDL